MNSCDIKHQNYDLIQKNYVVCSSCPFMKRFFNMISFKNNIISFFISLMKITLKKRLFPLKFSSSDANAIVLNLSSIGKQKK